MSLSEPSSPRSARLLRRVKTLKATTDELARLWQNQNKMTEKDSDSFDEAYAPTRRARMRSISLPGQSASERSLNSLASDLSRSDSMSNSLASSVLSDLSDLLIMPANLEDKPVLKRAKSAMCLTSMKYASPASKEKADGQKLTAFFGVSHEDVEFSDKYRKLMRLFGQDFPSHRTVLSIIADKQRSRDCDIHRPLPKLYSEKEVSEEQLRQRKKLESLTGLTEEDYGDFMLQLKLFHKLGEHVPLEELHSKKRSASLPSELEALDPNASKIERMLGAKKEVIIGQDKAKKAARLLGEQLPQHYCEELAKLDNAPEKISLHSRKISQPITEAEMKQAAKSADVKKKFGKSRSKKTIGFGKKTGGPAKPDRGGLSIMGTAFKSAAKGKFSSPLKGGLPPVKGAKTGKPLRR